MAGMPDPTTVETPSSDRNPRIKARSDAIRGAFDSPASHRCTAEQTLRSQSASLARKRIRTASPNISDTNAGNPAVAGIFLFAPHVASRPTRLRDGCIVPRRKAIRCTMKRTSLITLVGAEETLAKTFPATGNAPRSRLRICAQIGSWSVRRQHPYHYSDKLLLPFWTKYAVLGGGRFSRPDSFVNLRTRYSPYFKLMGNNTPTNQQERRPRKRRAPLKRYFLSKTR